MIKIIDNFVDDFFCDFCVDKLTTCDRWRIGGNLGNSVYEGNFGHILHSQLPDVETTDKNCIELNALAEYAVFKLVNGEYLSHNAKEIVIIRVNWNHYNQKGYVPEHADVSDNTSCIDNWQTLSLIIHLCHNDSYNIIGNERIKTIKNRCIVFDSTLLHSSQGSEHDPHRFTLNVVFRLR